MNEKPIIRHCRNCEYYETGFRIFDCTVRYKDVYCERMRALFCKYYKQKGGVE